MSEDLIKKEEAKEAVCKGCLKDWGICHHHWDCPMLTNLEMLLPANRPQGEWIDIDTLVLIGQCSVCGKWSDIRGNYCSWCGAHMKGADDEAQNRSSSE